MYTKLSETATPVVGENLGDPMNGEDPVRMVIVEKLGKVPREPCSVPSGPWSVSSSICSVTPDSENSTFSLSNRKLPSENGRSNLALDLAASIRN
jgi:hypothetical protein